ncbi:MAG: hypothetical protein HKN29_01795 [Rhodothermales bacterium]|nr:hypothetical protein [Rhodothermales bacterium]
MTWFGRIATGLGGLLVAATSLVFMGSDPPQDADPGPFGRVWSFSIKPGSQWAGPVLRRSLFWGSPTDRHDWDFRVRFDLSEVPDGMSFKIIGLSDLSGRMNRVKLYGWDEAPSIAHEDSDRFVGSVGYEGDTRGVWVSAYAYRAGYGGISGSRDVVIPDSIGPLSSRLGFIPDTTWAVLSLRRGQEAGEYWLHQESWPADSAAYVRIPMVYPPSAVQERWSGFTHAASGPSQPVSPGTLRFQIAKR